MTLPRARRPSVAALLTIILTVICSCWLPSAPVSRLLPDDGRPVTPALRDACTMTATRCTRCHTIDRVLVAAASSPVDWQAYVTRMRRMAGSGITEADGVVILRCLTSISQEDRREGYSHTD